MDFIYARNKINEFEKCRTEIRFESQYLPLLIVSYYINKRLNEPGQNHCFRSQNVLLLLLSLTTTDICLLLLLSVNVLSIFRADISELIWLFDVVTYLVFCFLSFHTFSKIFLFSFFLFFLSSYVSSFSFPPSMTDSFA